MSWWFPSGMGMNSSYSTAGMRRWVYRTQVYRGNRNSSAKCGTSW